MATRLVGSFQKLENDLLMLMLVVMSVPYIILWLKWGLVGVQGIVWRNSDLMFACKLFSEYIRMFPMFGWGKGIFWPKDDSLVCKFLLPKRVYERKKEGCSYPKLHPVLSHSFLAKKWRCYKQQHHCCKWQQCCIVRVLRAVGLLLLRCCRGQCC